jgi:hypothetical protein
VRNRYSAEESSKTTKRYSGCVSFFISSTV